MYAFNRLEQQLSNVTTARDALAARMLSLLEGAEFDGKRISEFQARPLIAEADLCWLCICLNCSPPSRTLYF